MKRPAEDHVHEARQRCSALPAGVNPEIVKFDVDYMYHLGITSDACWQFRDVRLICMHGSPERAKKFAEKAAKLFGSMEPVSPIGKTERTTMCKVGPVLSISHGMGAPSMLIFLHELTRLLMHAGVDLSDVEFVRLGTSGGVGVTPGTVVITNEAYDSRLQSGWEFVALGEAKRWPAIADPGLVKRLNTLAEKMEVPAIVASTMVADDYFEGQGRLDGALRTWYTEKDKLEFLQRAHDVGVRNIEMEGAAFLAFFGRLGAVSAAMVCPAFLDRFKGDQVTSPPELLESYANRTHTLLLSYISEKFRSLIK